MDRDLLAFVALVGAIFTASLGIGWLLKRIASLRPDVDFNALRLEKLGISDAAAIFGPTGVALVQALDGRTWLFTSKKAEPILLTLDNLLGVEILIDGVSVHQARRGRPISTVVLSAVTSGDTSAIIEASDVKPISIDNFSKISLLLHTNLKRRSELEMIIWDTHNRTMSTDIARQFKGNALEWSARLEIVMAGSHESAGALDDRLSRIQQLTLRREAGLITHSEFRTIQRQIIDEGS